MMYFPAPEGRPFGCSIYDSKEAFLQCKEED